jgi:hypothetical protein
MFSVSARNVMNSETIERIKEAANKDENPVKYLSIDPGKSNGICGYDVKYYLMFMLTLPADNITKFLHQFDKVDICILEDYKLFPNKAQQQVYSDMETSRVIGRVETWAELKDVKLIKQPSSIKPTGYAWIGEKPLPKSNPSNHSLDAHVHFIYWAVKNGKMDARKLLNRPGDM